MYQTLFGILSYIRGPGYSDTYLRFVVKYDFAHFTTSHLIELLTIVGTFDISDPQWYGIKTILGRFLAIRCFEIHEELWTQKLDNCWYVLLCLIPFFQSDRMTPNPKQSNPVKANYVIDTIYILFSRVFPLFKILSFYKIMNSINIF